MKLEALLAAVFLQLANVGFRKEPSFSSQPTGVTCECHCSCPSESSGLEGWQFLAAASIGAGITILVGVCGAKRQPTSAPVSPRRKGHGILEHSTWGYFGALVPGR